MLLAGISLKDTRFLLNSPSNPYPFYNHTSSYNHLSSCYYYKNHPPHSSHLTCSKSPNITTHINFFSQHNKSKSQPLPLPQASPSPFNHSPSLPQMSNRNYYIGAPVWSGHDYDNYQAYGEPRLKTYYICDIRYGWSKEKHLEPARGSASDGIR